MEAGDFNGIHLIMKEIRRFGLSMVDRNDFITCYRGTMCF